jgi:hypothetical protein
MMTDFEIRFDPTRQGADLRPPGAKELVASLTEFAHYDSEQLTTEEAGDAANYIRALEGRVQALQYQLWRTIEGHKRTDQPLGAFQQFDRDIFDF